MTRSRITIYQTAILMLTITASAACDKKEPAAPVEAPVATSPTPEAPAAATPPEEPASEADIEAAEAAIPAEEDPAASDTVVPVELGQGAPEGFEISGKVEQVLGWRDKYGTNAVVITSNTQKSGGGLLLAKHARQEGDGSWSEVRELRELVESCEFDLVLAPRAETSWSITDLDKDGIGEATFAWTADCTSDVSPNMHKVLLIEDGEKYVLRGVTQVEGMGGEFKADAAFDRAPAAFRAHAEKVWETTAR